MYCAVSPLNAELNPICHLLALLGGATIVVVSRLRVNFVVYLVRTNYNISYCSVPFITNMGLILYELYCLFVQIPRIHICHTYWNESRGL